MGSPKRETRPVFPQAVEALLYEAGLHAPSRINTTVQVQPGSPRLRQYARCIYFAATQASSAWFRRGPMPIDQAMVKRAFTSLNQAIRVPCSPE